MRYLYGLSDEKFVKEEFKEKATILHPYNFRVHRFLKGRDYFDKNDIPIVFKVSPDTLLNLCARIVDAIPLPPVYTWTNVDVCVWLRKYGYPQYRVSVVSPVHRTVQNIILNHNFFLYRTLLQRT